MRSFSSDYVCRPHPDVVRAVAEACARPSDGSYTEDSITASAVETLRSHFGSQVVVLFVSNGTAANRIALQTVLGHACDSVMCAERAHINTYECGALESLGHKLLPVPAADGKIGVAGLGDYRRQRTDVHLTRPRVLCISNATEMGTVYSVEELGLIGKYAFEHNLLLHVDGARLAYAAADLHPHSLRNITFDLGVQVVTLGGTKVGGMLGDAVIIREPGLAKVAVRIHKQQGQLCARQHVIAAQFQALFRDNLWHRLATSANNMAALLAKRCEDELGLQLAYPVQSNAVFVKLLHGVRGAVRRVTDFAVWSYPDDIVRFMCSWDTTEADVNELIELIKQNMR